jgi:lipopolysaccharide transport system ATP-binding protein
VNTLIDIHSVSKCYHIYEHPKDRFKQALLDKWRQLGRYKEKADYYREFWALRDISFQLEAGESVGILGRNGAGKSTLLQIVVGTITPTSGNVITHGRITALLELGSGFNPEFSGRENVLLNAQILGLTEAQALDKYDEIASFADIGDFINQPVKTYSSGMMVRLAFAVQTAVDPKILIIDEALAVGDMFFQAKCMARIRKLVDSGVALLFVSHATDVVRQLCSRAVLLQNGQMVSIGQAKKVADQYSSLQLEERNQAAKVTLEGRERLEKSLRDVSPQQGDMSLLSATGSVTASAGLTVADWSDHPARQVWSAGIESYLVRAPHNRIGNGDAEIINVQMLADGNLSARFEFDEEATIRVFAGFRSKLHNVNLSLQIRNRQGTGLVFFDLRLQKQMHQEYCAGHIYLFEWKVKLPLMTESYSLQCILAHPPLHPGDDWVFIDSVPDAFEFSVSPIPNLPVSSFVVLPAKLEILDANSLVK